MLISSHPDSGFAYTGTDSEVYVRYEAMLLVLASLNRHNNITYR